MNRKLSILLSPLFAFVLILFPFLLSAQSDTTRIWVGLPSNFDFSTIATATATITGVITAIWTVISGYFSAKWDWVTKVTFVLNTPARRVGAFGFLSSFLAALLFGFSKDAQTALFAAFLALVGTFTGMGFYDVFLKSKK